MQRSALLFKVLSLKREKRLTDCSSYDGRIVVKDNDSKITTVTRRPTWQLFVRTQHAPASDSWN